LTYITWCRLRKLRLLMVQLTRKTYQVARMKQRLTKQERSETRQLIRMTPRIKKLKFLQKKE